jgi:SAM-dependent methyltransferase
LVYLGVALSTLATLILELSLTRIFSVVFYYHFAFLAISIALFGLGAGGVFSYVVAGWRGALFHKLGSVSAWNGVLVTLSLVFILSRDSEPSNWTLALVYFASALPFFLSGAVISLAISETIARVERVYFFDLVGAAAGCLLLIPFLNAFGGPNTVIIAGALFAVSSALWFNLAGSATGRVAGVAVSLALVGLVMFNVKQGFIDIRHAKGRPIGPELFVKWNSFSRIAMAPDKDWPEMMSIVIDADAATGVANFDFDRLGEKERKDLLASGPGLPYVIRPAAKTLVIGSGGGWDLARALASGSRDVTGVEINPIIARTIMRERFPGLSRRLYFRPEVRIEVEDGRSFVRRTKEKYQVLQATLVDTWASTAAGAFALSENNLYTTDAFEDYFRILTDDGLLVFTRWGLDPPRESLRLVSLGMAALGRLGENEPWRHFFVVREGKTAGWGALDTVIISRRPMPVEDVSRGRLAAISRRLEMVYSPGDTGGNPFADLLRARDPEAFQRAYRYDISPVDDDRPFFFYSVQPRDLWEFITSASRTTADYKVNKAVPLLFTLLGVSLAATLIVLALPPLVLGGRLPRHPGVPAFLLYFAAIGAGYILIEVALIQKFVLLLGHPTYALTVIVFSMLVSSGIGSYLSRRLLAGSLRRLRRVLAGIAALVAGLACAAGPVSAAGAGWPLGVKFLVVVLLIAPAGFLMGMPFPTGLTRLEAWHKPSVRWAWSLNAASSVLGSGAAILFALYAGLRGTLLLGGALYLVALLLAGTAGRVERPAAPAA